MDHGRCQRSEPKPKFEGYRTAKGGPMHGPRWVPDSDYGGRVGVE